MYRNVIQICGAVFAVVAFASLLIAVCTKSWITIQVDREGLAEETQDQTSITGLAFWTRTRGLWQECFTNQDSVELAEEIAKNEFKVYDNSYCIYVDYMVPRSQAKTYFPEYRSRAALMTAELVMLILALVFNTSGFCVYIYSTFLSREQRDKRWALASKWAGILLFVTGFLGALGMALFHGAEFLELDKVQASSADPFRFYFKASQPNVLQNNISRYYDWSYALAWLSVGLAILSGLLFFFPAVCCVSPDEKDLFENATTMSHKSYGNRNRAYDYVQDNYPVVLQPIEGRQLELAAPDDYYQKGRFFDPYTRGQVRNEFNPQYTFEGGWKWQ